jgi:hypothetical protein
LVPSKKKVDVESAGSYIRLAVRQVVFTDVQ